MNNAPVTLIVTTPDDVKKAICEAVRSAIVDLKEDLGVVIRPQSKYLAPKDIALEFGLPTKLLQYWRSIGVGPHYSNLGRRVFYERAEFEEYVASGRIETLPFMGDE
ncbi:MAG: helix-turn-helix domain-containing protein [Acidaminococcaceae bacterium]|nr:helix-turn-helix domain-containing protein [Acidaminococcaceae bacterium]